MIRPIQNIDSLANASGECDEASKSDEPIVKTQAQLDFEEGRGYVERGEAALAAVALHNALRGFEEENNREGIANAANQLGHACLIRKEFDKAIVNYKKAWEICDSLNDHISLMSVAKQLAEAHQGLGEYRQALDLYLDLLDSYQRNNDPKNSVDILERMASVYVDAGEKEKAADAYKTAAAVHENFRHSSFADALKKKAAELMKDSE